MGGRRVRHLEELRRRGFRTHRLGHGRARMRRVLGPRQAGQGRGVDRQPRQVPEPCNWTTEVGARYGRVRVIKLAPQSDDRATHLLHLDDNNRLNPDGEGWVVRTWLELTDNPGSFMIVRSDKNDPATEHRIELRKGAQYVVDSERLYHAVTHAGPHTRYAVIASFESGPQLEKWIESRMPEGAGSRSR